jgi:hypothetical protein
LEAYPSYGPSQIRTVSPKLASPRIRRREIAAADLDGIASLLRKGFPARPRDHWLCAFQRLSNHPTPAGLPKYGYMLEREGVPVGVSIQIFSSVPAGGESRIRCNLSSWYVEPAYRGYAPALASETLKRKDVTFFNVTPALHTLRTIEAQGFEKYCSGWLAAVPALSRSRDDAQVVAVSPHDRRDAGLEPFEHELLTTHLNYGCISAICRTADNRTYPFVFMPRRKFGVLAFAYLIYCREIADLVRFARPLGRFLIKAGIPVVVLDSDGPVPGLVGKFLDTRPKYFKGPDRPRMGDLAYSEIAMFPIRGERTLRGLLGNPLDGSINQRRWGHSK